MNALSIVIDGKSCREMLLAETCLKSRHKVTIHIVSEVTNPGLERVATTPVRVHRSDDVEYVAAFAKEVEASFGLIGPEEPLGAGVVDKLLEVGVPCVGPTKELAQLETSKSFTRRLFSKYGIDGNPEYRIFETDDGLEEYLNHLGTFVIKPDGLTGGKGVRVWGDHIQSIDEGLSYCRELLAAGGTVVVEEKLDGEEFTLQAFCDGHTVINMPPVQDHKRLLDGDKGPNTGGMGSYSCADHLLPFLTREELAIAQETNSRVAAALLEETGHEYKGILYGSFIITRSGLRVIEYNARFGDPEATNVLSILETDFVDICQAIIDGTLDQVDVRFANKATVCKYIVPEGYPEESVKDVAIELPDIDNSGPNLRMYFGAVGRGKGDEVVLTGSRAIAFVGIGATLAEAERAAERGASSVRGPVFHRKDIGTAALVQRRVDHVNAIHNPDHRVRHSA